MVTVQYANGSQSQYHMHVDFKSIKYLDNAQNYFSPVLRLTIQ